jgi:hypothetical protein
VSFLGVFPGLEKVWLRRQVPIAVGLSDELSNRFERVVAHPHRVGAHVRDQTDLAAVFLQIDAS